MYVWVVGCLWVNWMNLEQACMGTVDMWAGLLCFGAHSGPGSVWQVHDAAAEGNPGTPLTGGLRAAGVFIGLCCWACHGM
jgi:hypothetical protein